VASTPDRHHSAARTARHDRKELYQKTERHSAWPVHKPTEKVNCTMSDQDAPATVEQIAAMEFQAVKELRALSQDERFERAAGMFDLLRPIANLPGEILADEKTELMAKVAERHDAHGPMLKRLALASDDARVFME
jgi:hypothetical protein